MSGLSTVEPASPLERGEPGATRRGRRHLLRGPAVALLVVAAFGVLPFLDVAVPVVLPGPVSSPGSLQLLAIALVFAGLAVSYDVIFGYTGLLSFGHALFFGAGAYLTNLLMGRGIGYVASAAIYVLVTSISEVALGGIELCACG